MKMSWTRIPLTLVTPFQTAKARRTRKENVWIRIEHEGIEGWGEAAPVETYAQSVESVEQALLQATELKLEDPHSLDRHIRTLVEALDDQRATVAAIDAAMHDWIGKRYGIPVVRWLGLEAAPATTSFTLGIDDPDGMARKAESARTYPILKIKLGLENDREIIQAVRRAAPDKKLRVDANGGWTVEQALEMLPFLARMGVEFVEQPLPRENLDGLRKLRDAGICPIVADESCIRPEDVLRVAGCVDGINIKLSKCGGIREAVCMIHLARAHNLKVMLGCMIESSLGIATAAQLAPLADWLDLDGHLLISDDPFEGIGGARGILTTGRAPGLGVWPRSEPGS